MQVRRLAAHSVCTLTIVAMLASCGLPRSGPGKREIMSAAEAAQYGIHVVSVTPPIAAAARRTEALGFGSEFINAGLVSPDSISPGDTLGITVWENVDTGLLAGVGERVTSVEEVQVDETGHVFMPYVGRIEAGGGTPEGLRQQITESLALQTPDPQVEVRRVSGDGSSVSVLGGVREPGVYPIQTPTRRLSAMLAQAGGVELVPEVAQVKMERGGRTGRIWLQDLYDNPSLDVALRAGDRIIVEEDRRSFTALGATTGQSRVSFDKRDMSAVEAIAASGGLDGNAADPTGVFVFRQESAEVASRVTGRTDLVGPQQIAYILDLTKPDGLFSARDFIIRDEDTVYVTEAPFATWRQVIALTATVVSLGGSVAAISR